MRFIGLVLVLVALAASYFLAYKGMTIDQARTRLAQLLNLPGLAPPATAAQGASGLSGGAAGQGLAGGGGGGW